MMTNGTLLWIAVAAIVLLPEAAPAHAQADTPSSVPPAPVGAQSSTLPLTPRGDLFSGVAFFEQEGTSLCGFQLTGTWRAGAHVGVVGDMAVYGDYTSVMGGVRIQSSRRHPMFVQVLAGKAPVSFFAIQPGIGFDLPVGRRVAVRPSGDLKISGDDSKTFVGTRLSMGLVVRLGQQ